MLSYIELSETLTNYAKTGMIVNLSTLVTLIDKPQVVCVSLSMEVSVGCDVHIC